MILLSWFKGHRDYGNTVGQARPTVLNPEQALWPPLKKRGKEGVTWCSHEHQDLVLGLGQVAELGTWAALQASGVQTCTNSYCPINFYAQTSKRGTINRE